MKLIDSAIVAALVWFVGAAFSWYVAVPLGAAGIYFIFVRKSSAFEASGPQRPTQVIDDLDDPNGSISIANSYHHLRHDE